MGLFDKLKGGRKDADVEALIGELKHRDPKVRFAAARKLGELGARAAPAQSALEEAIADEDGEVCLAASDALSQIRKAAL